MPLIYRVFTSTSYLCYLLLLIIIIMFKTTTYKTLKKALSNYLRTIA